MHAGEPAKYKVERWDSQDAHVEEIVATATLIMIGHAAFHAPVEQYPRSRLTLRQGARVILKNPRVIAVELVTGGGCLDESPVQKTVRRQRAPSVSQAALHGDEF